MNFYILYNTIKFGSFYREISIQTLNENNMQLSTFFFSLRI